MDTIATGRATTGWRSAAACRGESPATFFDPELAEWAKRICSRCPVTDACRAEATDHAVAHGVWGGWTPEERRTGRTSEQPAPPRRDHRGFVTPACGACSVGLAWPLVPSPTSQVSEGRMTIEVIDGAEWIVLHRDDLRFARPDDGELRCPGCHADLGRLFGHEARLRPGAVSIEDTKQRRRRMQGAISA